MKTTKILSLVLALIMCFGMTVGLCGCNSEKTTEPTVVETIAEETMPAIWNNAVYTEDATVGEGDTQIQVEVKADEKAITLTVNTNAKTLGDALLENELVAGDMGEYGLYIKTVNGMLADYDVDGTYWAMFKDGEYLMTGADTTDIANGEHYEIVCSK